MSNRSHMNLRRQRGVGMIEVLVTLLILSIGMLGLAALQMRTLRNNQSSLERSMAVAETHAIADAMRADRTNAINGRFNIALGSAAPTGTTFREVMLASWLNNLVSSLGADATGSVACNGALCTIVVRWNDSRGTGGVDQLSISTQVQL